MLALSGAGEQDGRHDRLDLPSSHEGRLFIDTAEGLIMLYWHISDICKLLIVQQALQAVI